MADGTNGSETSYLDKRVGKLEGKIIAIETSQPFIAKQVSSNAKQIGELNRKMNKFYFIVGALSAGGAVAGDVIGPWLKALFG